MPSSLSPERRALAPARASPERSSGFSPSGRGGVPAPKLTGCRAGSHLLVAQEEPVGGHMQDARTVEPLELLLGGICPGEHLLRIELEQPLQRLGLGGGARKRREHEAAAVQVARAVRADIGRRPACALTVSPDRPSPRGCRAQVAGAAARLNRSRPLVR